MAASLTEDNIEIEFNPKTINEYYWKFLLLGFSAQQSANLVASLMGLAPSQKGAWTLQQLLNIDFLQIINTKIES